MGLAERGDYLADRGNPGEPVRHLTPAESFADVQRVRRARPLRILMVHNAYRERGGEDAVVASETALLRDAGHPVASYLRHNHELDGLSPLRVAADALWSRRTQRDLAALVADFAPDVIHAHNTFPLISPSLYWAAEAAGVPVVQTLHNFRLLCPQGMFLRDGRVCEDCLGRLPLAAARHGCYRGSRAQSAVLGGMLAMHRGLGTWQNKVTRFIALNAFCRDKFIAGGLPAARILVKPNFVAADTPAPPARRARAGFLYAGRLAPEKGLAVLRAALDHTGMTAGAGIAVRIAGAGSESSRFAGVPQCTLLGELAPTQVRAEMQQALALVMPSLWFENAPLTLIEAYACGLPVIASRIGALPGLVEDRVTGLLFEPGSAAGLAACLAWAQANPHAMVAMGQAARRRFEAEFTADLGYRWLLDTYEAAIAAHLGVRRS